MPDGFVAYVFKKVGKLYNRDKKLMKIDHEKVSKPQYRKEYLEEFVGKPTTSAVEHAGLVAEYKEWTKKKEENKAKKGDQGEEDDEDEDEEEKPEVAAKRKPARAQAADPSPGEKRKKNAAQAADNSDDEPIRKRGSRT